MRTRSCGAWPAGSWRITAGPWTLCSSDLTTVQVLLSLRTNVMQVCLSALFAFFKHLIYFVHASVNMVKFGLLPFNTILRKKIKKGFHKDLNLILTSLWHLFPQNVCVFLNTYLMFFLCSVKYLGIIILYLLTDECSFCLFKCSLSMMHVWKFIKYSEQL